MVDAGSAAQKLYSDLRARDVKAYRETRRRAHRRLPLQHHRGACVDANGNTNSARFVATASSDACVDVTSSLETTNE